MHIFNKITIIICAVILLSDSAVISRNNQHVSFKNHTVGTFEYLPNIIVV
ncbi:MAG: hypothetical protein Kow0042_22030 [Calditrichia bacterium]